MDQGKSQNDSHHKTPRIDFVWSSGEMGKTASVSQVIVTPNSLVEIDLLKCNRDRTLMIVPRISKNLTTLQGPPGPPTPPSDAFYTSTTNVLTQSSVPQDESSVTFFLEPSNLGAGEEPPTVQMIFDSSTLQDGTVKKIYRNVHKAGRSVDPIDLMPSGPNGNVYEFLPDPSESNCYLCLGQYSFVGNQTDPIEARSMCRMRYDSSTDSYSFEKLYKNDLRRCLLQQKMCYPSIFCAATLTNGETNLLYIGGVFNTLQDPGVACNLGLLDLSSVNNSVVPINYTLDVSSTYTSCIEAASQFSSNTSVVSIQLDALRKNLAIAGNFTSIGAAPSGVNPAPLGLVFLSVDGSSDTLYTNAVTNGRVVGMFAQHVGDTTNLWLYGGFTAENLGLTLTNTTNSIAKFSYTGADPSTGSWTLLDLSDDPSSVLDEAVLSAVVIDNVLFLSGRFLFGEGLCKYNLSGAPGTKRLVPVTNAIPRNLFALDFLSLFVGAPDKLIANVVTSNTGQVSEQNGVYELTLSTGAVVNWHHSNMTLGAVYYDPTSPNATTGSYLLSTIRTIYRDALSVTHGYTRTRSICRFIPQRVLSVDFGVGPSVATLRTPDNEAHRYMKFFNNGTNAELVFSKSRNAWIVSKMSEGTFVQ